MSDALTIHTDPFRALAHRSKLVSGIADDPEGGLRVYVGARYEDNWIVVEDDAVIAEVRSIWAMTNTTGWMFIERDA
jgi:hypothetical protein